MPGFNPISLGGGRTTSGRAEDADCHIVENFKLPCEICNVIHPVYNRDGRYWQKKYCKQNTDKKV